MDFTSERSWWVTPNGTNTIPVQTLTNGTSAPIDVIYLITANYAGCVTQNANDTITVNPIPTVTTNPLAQTVCEGTATQAINLTSAVAGVTFTWGGSSANGITGFIANGNTNTIPAQTLNNQTTQREQLSIQSHQLPTVPGLTSQLHNHRQSYS